MTLSASLHVLERQQVGWTPEALRLERRCIFFDDTLKNTDNGVSQARLLFTKDQSITARGQMASSLVL